VAVDAGGDTAAGADTGAGADTAVGADTANEVVDDPVDEDVGDVTPADTK
jgi:hypothetical protein